MMIMDRNCLDTHKKEGITLESRKQRTLARKRKQTNKKIEVQSLGQAAPPENKVHGRTDEQKVDTVGYFNTNKLLLRESSENKLCVVWVEMAKLLA